jgi:pimeloyl-ACP methyl ester carboxylesterase
MRGEFVDLDGVRLYCYAFGARGAGHPIVLVHGSFTSSHLWQDVLARLPRGHRVLILDLLGHGRSDPPGQRAMTVAAHASRLEQLLDVLGVAEVTLVGHDMGAAVATRLAFGRPDRVAHLMLVNPTLLAGNSAEAPLNRRLRRVALLGWLWQRLSPAWLASALHAALLPGFAHHDRGARSLDVYLKAFRQRRGRDAACAQLQALAHSRGDTVDALAPGAIRCPTALVLGEHDPVLDEARRTRLEGWLQQATNGRLTVHTLPGVAHFAPEEAPDRLGALVSELVSR